MSQVENRLGKIGSLDNASNFDCALFFDQLSDRFQQIWRELGSELVAAMGLGEQETYLRIPFILPSNESNESS